MVVLSAALKSLPAEIMDAARIDGANEIQIFFKIIIPNLKPTLITVATAVLIAVLKVFDIVYVMTNGQYNTEVIANRMYAEMFKNRNFGLGSALAVLLLLAVVPVMVANVRNLRKERG
jgi:alpha-glucoside transport system permease protein